MCVCILDDASVCEFSFASKNVLLYFLFYLRFVAFLLWRGLSTILSFNSDLVIKKQRLEGRGMKIDFKFYP